MSITVEAEHLFLCMPSEDGFGEPPSMEEVVRAPDAEHASRAYAAFWGSAPRPPVSLAMYRALARSLQDGTGLEHADAIEQDATDLHAFAITTPTDVKLIYASGPEQAQVLFSRSFPGARCSGVSSDAEIDLLIAMIEGAVQWGMVIDAPDATPPLESVP